MALKLITKTKTRNNTRQSFLYFTDPPGQISNQKCMQAQTCLAARKDPAGECTRAAPAAAAAPHSALTRNHEPTSKKGSSDAIEKAKNQ
jgi:hypothetical protein